MAFPFGEAPTLREFVEKAKGFGVDVRQAPVIDGPEGPIRFAYLWIDAQRFVPLPDMSYDERLAPDMVDHLARRLQISTESFWEGFRGFDEDDE